MKALYCLRTLLLALAVSVMPAISFGGVFISVNFAPPVLPVYEQPPCPEPGLIWNPGYWAYDEDGYYWVPGTWVPAPYEGALWTPPYWGWDGGLYVFHPGYWGTHVGYYGGVNYGFGYMGVGFVGGMWRGHDFIYNTAVMRVDERRVRNVYVDRDVVRRYTVVNDRHVSFSGGRDGIHHDPLPEERFADRDRHVTETSYQQSHENAARSDRSYYARNNGGRPNNVVVQRPMGSGPNTIGDSNRGPFQGRDNSNQNNQNRDNNQRDQYRNTQQQDNPQYRGGDPRSNQRGADNRNVYNPPQNVNNGQNNQNRGNPQQDQNVPQQNNPHDRGFGDPRSNERGHDNRNTYNPPPNAGSQGRDNNNQRPDQRQDQYRNQNPQPGNQAPQYRNAPPPPQQQQPQAQQQPQWRQYNNGHGGQDNMQNRGGPPPQQQPQPQPQPQQPRGDQGGGGNHGGGDHGGDHGRGHDR